MRLLYLHHCCSFSNTRNALAYTFDTKSLYSNDRNYLRAADIQLAHKESTWGKMRNLTYNWSSLRGLVNWSSGKKDVLLLLRTQVQFLVPQFG